MNQQDEDPSLAVPCLLYQRVSIKDGNPPSKQSPGIQSGGEEEPEPDDEPHLPLPPPMEIMKDPSASEEKVSEEVLVSLRVYSPQL